ncbi:hypothetical protein [Mesorhizobium abyssinicae]|uniref:hypothetical protein n=1 Tax=Mesorhizobium abyssinicae TaxID=1209958 RepID=UPI003CEAC7A7
MADASNAVSPAIRVGHSFRAARWRIGRMAKGWTFQSLIDAKVALLSQPEADLAQLRDRYGPDSPAMANDLIPKLKCRSAEAQMWGCLYARHKAERLWQGPGP